MGILDTNEKMKLSPLLLPVLAAGDVSRHCAFSAERDNIPGGSFPAGFKWSCATASYQIEGAWNKDGKGLNIWDEFSHYRGPAPDGSSQPNPIDPESDCAVKPCQCMVDECHNGDDACRSYDNVERDIELLVGLKVKSYRFSLSWSRLIPDGKTFTSPNQKGIDYYDSLINGLIDNGIIPMVTLYHWDLPSALQTDSCKGWLCKKTIEHFENYSRFCYQTFGDRVKYWITLNEPAVFSDAGHNYCEMAPGICGGNELGRQARHNSLLAHAKAYRVYENEFKTQQKGQCGITLNSGYSQPEDPNNEKDVLASETAMSLYLGWWADPIYKAGDYSQVMKDALNRESEWNAYYELSEAEKSEIKGSSDFFGLNHYGSDIVRWNDNAPYGVEYMPRCEEWKTTGSAWLFPVPWAFRSLLNFIDEHYDSQQYPIFVTENGLSSRDSTGAGIGNGTDMAPNLNDQFRIDFYNEYIGQMQRAIDEDGVNVEAYTAWSLMDNFEWARGYTERFGLHWVNYTDPNRAVYVKESAKWYAKVSDSNTVPEMIIGNDDSFSVKTIISLTLFSLFLL